MQHRFAAQQARLSAFIEQGFNHVARKTGFSPLQWALCGILAVVSFALAVCLVSIRNNTADLNANMKDNTRAVVDLKSNLVNSIDGLDRKLAETNQKLSDLAVEIDDLITAQKVPDRQADPTAAARQKSNAKDVGAPRTAQKQTDLVVHRRRAVRYR